MTLLTNENYVDYAEHAILGLLREESKKKNHLRLTTTQLRNLLSLTSTLYDLIQTQSYDSLIDRISYLRVQFVYQAGRNDAVKIMVEQANILNIIKEIRDKESLIRFCRYMEALVAYFKYYGGKD